MGFTAAFKERLRAETGREVFGATRLAAAEKDRHRDAIYVIFLGRTASDNRLQTSVRQTVTISMGVVTALKNVRDKRGEAALGEVEEVTSEILLALLGWTPPDADGPVFFRAGRVAAFTAPTLFWQDEYYFDHLLEAA